MTCHGSKVCAAAVSRHSRKAPGKFADVARNGATHNSLPGLLHLAHSSTGKKWTLAFTRPSAAKAALSLLTTTARLKPCPDDGTLRQMATGLPSRPLGTIYRTPTDQQRRQRSGRWRQGCQASSPGVAVLRPYPGCCEASWRSDSTLAARRCVFGRTGGTPSGQFNRTSAARLKPCPDNGGTHR